MSDDTFRPHNIALRFFSEALASFRDSNDTVRVLCTVPARWSDPTTPVPAPRQPSLPLRRLLVLDSSFNPPTVAHAGMLKSAIAAEDAHGAGTRALLLLALNNADKAPRPASFAQRLGMMLSFAEELLRDLGRGREGDEPDKGAEIDIGVTVRPFFHEKSRAIADSEFYGRAPGSDRPPDQVFLAGHDTLVRILDQKYYADMDLVLGPFFERARLRVTARPGEWGDGQDQENFPERALDGERAAWGKRITVVGGEDTVEIEGVSSSRVRAALAEGKWWSVEHMVGESVKEWIGNMRIYSGE